MEIVTANSLADGRVVFQTAFGWSFHIDEAHVLDSKEAVATALERANADAAQNRVVEPYAIEVTLSDGCPAPVRLRERIRAEGPTTGNSKPRTPANQKAA